MRELVARQVVFFSQEDENVFFNWLRKISIVRELRGRHSDIVIELGDDAISDDDLRELVAVFLRYAVDMRQLAQFLTRENSTWFADKKKRWHRKIFK